MTLGTTEQGCLLVADITGYTQYIGDTEITHAQDVVADLIETIVGVITPTFRLSRVEGDAAFAFAPIGSIGPGILHGHGRLHLLRFQRAPTRYRSCHQLSMPGVPPHPQIHLNKGSRQAAVVG